jgi:type II secretory pathway pseudopilin PulG
MPNVGHKSRRAFTLVEAVLAMAITVIAGSAVLLGIASAIQTTDSVLASTQASGMARQLMDEIAGQLYCEDTAFPNQYPLGPFGEARHQYNDIDDYHGWTSQPPVDRYLVALGTENRQGGLRDPNFRIPTNYFAYWEQSVAVYYVSASNPSQNLAAGQVSDFRAVEVTIRYVHPTQPSRTLARLRRVFSYVPVN